MAQKCAYAHSVGARVAHKCAYAHDRVNQQKLYFLAVYNYHDEMNSTPSTHYVDWFAT